MARDWFGTFLKVFAGSGIIYGAYMIIRGILAAKLPIPEEAKPWVMTWQGIALATVSLLILASYQRCICSEGW